jgi:hypothetical protein
MAEDLRRRGADGRDVVADRLVVDLSADGLVSVGSRSDGDLHVDAAGEPFELAWHLDDGALDELRWYLEDPPGPACTGPSLTTSRAGTTPAGPTAPSATSAPPNTS